MFCTHGSFTYIFQHHHCEDTLVLTRSDYLANKQHSATDRQAPVNTLYARCGLTHGHFRRNPDATSGHSTVRVVLHPPTHLRNR